jgi:hypothetical protein
MIAASAYVLNVPPDRREPILDRLRNVPDFQQGVLVRKLVRKSVTPSRRSALTANNSNFCRSRARASLRDQPLALPAWDQQEETEQSDSRTDRGRAIDTRVQSELVSSIVPRGTSLRWIVAPTVWRYANDSDFQSKIAQQTTDIVLDRKSFFLDVHGLE